MGNHEINPLFKEQQPIKHKHFRSQYTKFLPSTHLKEESLRTREAQEPVTEADLQQNLTWTDHMKQVTPAKSKDCDNKFYGKITVLTWLRLQRLVKY